MSLEFNFAKIPTAAWPLGVGLLVTSPLLFGNIGLSLTGPLPIIKGEIGPVELSKKQKVRVWALFFNAATPYIVGGTVLTTSIHAIAAFITSNSQARVFSIASAVSSISIIPFTLVAIMPTNQALLALDAKKELTAAEEADAMILIRKWDQRHKVRYIGYGLGWAFGLLALLTLANDM